MVLCCVDIIEQEDKSQIEPIQLYEMIKFMKFVPAERLVQGLHIYYVVWECQAKLEILLYFSVCFFRNSNDNEWIDLFIRMKAKSH